MGSDVKQPAAEVPLDPLVIGTCETCVFFNAETKRPRKGQSVRYGSCQRFPPTVKQHNNEEWQVKMTWVPAGWHWPRMYSSQWCGEWKSR